MLLHTQLQLSLKKAYALSERPLHIRQTTESPQQSAQERLNTIPRARSPSPEAWGTIRSKLETRGFSLRSERFGNETPGTPAFKTCSWDASLETHEALAGWEPLLNSHALGLTCPHLARRLWTRLTCFQKTDRQVSHLAASRGLLAGLRFTSALL